MLTIHCQPKTALGIFLLSCLFSARVTVASDRSADVNPWDLSETDINDIAINPKITSPGLRISKKEAGVLTGEATRVNLEKNRMAESAVYLRENVDPRGSGVAVLAIAPPYGIMLDGAIANMEFNKTNLERLSVYNRYESGRQPIVGLVDNYGQIVASASFEVTARLYNNPGCTILHGNSVVRSSQGQARFTDLMIDNGAAEYRFIFSTGLRSSPIEVVSESFIVARGQLYIPFDPVWNPPDPGSARQITAGDLLQSTLNESLQPRSGFAYPVVWLRVFDPQNASGGPELDGWADDTSFEQEVQLSLSVDPVIANNFDSRYCSRRVGALVCVSGVFGTRTATAEQVRRAGGRAEFRDVRVAMAGRHRLLFTSPGFRSFSVAALDVVPTDAATLLILQQPGNLSDAGFALRTMPALNLVDRFNNSVLQAGWSVAVEVSAPYLASCGEPGQEATEPRTTPCRCATDRCAAYVNYAPLNITGPAAEMADGPGVLRFTDLVLIRSGASFVLTFRATRTGGGGFAIVSRSATVAVRPGPLVAMILQNKPWVPTPVVGLVFKTQPRLWFIDRFQNVIQAVSDVLVQCELAGADGVGLGDQSALSGERSAKTVNGQAQFTSLAIGRPGGFYIRFFFASYEAVAQGETGLGFTVNSGPLARIVFVRQPRNAASGAAFNPELSLQFVDQLDNVINTDYFFILQVEPSKFFFQGSLVDDATLLSCSSCLKGGGKAQFSPGKAATANFTDLIPILDTRLQFKTAAQLRVFAVNLSRCVTQGTYEDCSAFPGDPERDPTLVDGRRVQGVSDPFDIYLVSALTISGQPADTSASM
jgi:hypothetical protein